MSNHPSGQPSLEHRTFLLSLDPEDGQEIAAHAGYAHPSDDVASREMDQVRKDWMLMAAEGTLKDINRYANWFAGVVLPDTATKVEKLQTIQSVTVFTIAALARLKNRGSLETPADRRLTPVMMDRETGEQTFPNQIPDDMLEHAAEMAMYLEEEAHDLKQ